MTHSVCISRSSQLPATRHFSQWQNTLPGRQRYTHTHNTQLKKLHSSVKHTSGFCSRPRAITKWLWGGFFLPSPPLFFYCTILKMIMQKIKWLQFKYCESVKNSQVISLNHSNKPFIQSITAVTELTSDSLNCKSSQLSFISDSKHFMGTTLGKENCETYLHLTFHNILYWYIRALRILH